MYRLIADSGSTKTTWHLLKSGQSVQQEQSTGINPYYLDDAALQQTLREALMPFPLAQIEHLHFFGAGCDSDLQSFRMRKALKQHLPAAKLEVASDLWAAIRATAGKQPGIVAILGTGSSSCAFNGYKITQQTPSLGFLLGDEGSGSHLGKRLLQAFFYKELPEDLYLELIRRGYGLNNVLKSVYEQPYPNRFVAQFVPFLKTHIERPFIAELVYGCFAEFIYRHLGPYREAHPYPVHFVGSVAYHFQDILRELLQEQGWELGKILKAPFPSLLEQY